MKDLTYTMNNFNPIEVIDAIAENGGVPSSHINMTVHKADNTTLSLWVEVLPLDESDWCDAGTYEFPMVDEYDFTQYVETVADLTTI